MEYLLKIKDGQSEDISIVNLLLDRPDGEYVLTIQKKVNTRTALQNRSLHLWFNQLAKALNDAGFDMKKVVRQELDIKWTDYNIKEYLFKPTAKMLFGKDSTRQLTTKEVSEVHELIAKTISERTGVYVDWPCVESLMRAE